jgi:hypothetical protein
MITEARSGMEGVQGRERTIRYAIQQMRLIIVRGVGEEDKERADSELTHADVGGSMIASGGASGASNHV